ncbi:MAG TPA: metalloregulator ArsR/SmtB family transcription factor [bacterium]|nr:metalloregulator ArsR/SmtB family transcription factor [bacterium]
MERIVDIARALGDPGRVRVLLALRGRELCVCQLVLLLDLATSTVSRHLAVLRRAGLVEARKDGRWVHYRRAGRDAPGPVRSALRWLDRSLPEDARARRDHERLERILEIPAEELCREGRPAAGPPDRAQGVRA